ncbi:MULTISPECIES: tyrosine-type recombinase/integrase [Yersinia pseudotuberculosis complex]|uniref:Phage integrase family n=1 Tax=Yersinia similis TaxID=367190 RepID=A0A0T9QLC0_9GAMM|nr:MULTISPECIES: tyrosine-type recombinase/integrase [Yersinia pseudotuberculosis complex]AIN12727.1 phage integrase family protein [Yersinia pseudotuberculosis]CNI17053.1 Phage integrase family [Yersinia similis]
MVRNVTQKLATPNNDGFLTALARWEACKPPYTSSHMKICVTAAKVILSQVVQPRRSKYEKESFLRIDFSKAGKVTFYAEFPKKMALKGKKLGEWPEMAIQVAREKAKDLSEGGLTSDSVHSVIRAYEADLALKVSRHRLGEDSYRTYLTRTKNVSLAFSDREVFSGITYHRLTDILDDWIATKSSNQAIELFAEMRRFWKYSSPLYSCGKNIAASIPDDYISSRVQKPTATRLFTDIESIAKLWINIASCASVHQKNAMRFMILTGVRPINVSNLRWDYVDSDLAEIIYPAGVTGMRGAMKTQKEFRLPVTNEIKRILEEQLGWGRSVDNYNKEYVFLQPRDLMKPFAKRSLDKLIKTYSPENAVKGVIHDGTVKGREGAFNTMCRKFLKSNIIAQMRSRGYSRSDTREISQLCMHHSDKGADPMGEHYDFSDEILHEEMALKRLAFESHEASILTQVALIRKRLS